MTRWRRTTACERAAQWISLELDGELGRVEQAALARHLCRCERCRTSDTEVRAFTMLVREAPPVEPARLIAVAAPSWAQRRARARLGAGVLALAAALGAALTLGVLPHSENGFQNGGGFAGSQQQQMDVVRDHVRSEPRLFVSAEYAPAPSLASHPLL
jgi:ferric-dicitrate binding protein FerR (iron transport regulator)